MSADFSIYIDGFQVELPRKLCDPNVQGYVVKPEVIEWIQYSIKQPWRDYPGFRPTVCFKDKAEAALFKLFWL